MFLSRKEKLIHTLRATHRQPVTHMQIQSRKEYKQEKTAKGRARQEVNYSVAKLKSSGLFDARQKNGRVKVRRIADLTPQERSEMGIPLLTAIRPSINANAHRF